MKFAASCSIHQDKLMQPCTRWAPISLQERTNARYGAKIIGYWGDLAARAGVMILWILRSQFASPHEWRTLQPGKPLRAPKGPTTEYRLWPSCPMSCGFTGYGRSPAGDDNFFARRCQRALRVSSGVIPR